MYSLTADLLVAEIDLLGELDHADKVLMQMGVFWTMADRFWTGHGLSMNQIEDLERKLVRERDRLRAEAEGRGWDLGAHEAELAKRAAAIKNAWRDATGR